MSLMLTSFLRLSLLAYLGVLFPVVAGAQTATLSPHVTQEALTHQAVDSAAIRLHRLKHFDAKLNANPTDLRATCRYESEIGTAPPAKRIALTFDDGPQAGQTEFILETLKRHNVGATFFMVGEQAKKHPDLVAMVDAAGHHLIGNHSWNHPNFHSIDTAEQAIEVHKAEEVLSKESRLRFFRYPYGNSSCETNELLHNSGYKIVGWHVDSCDWAFERSGAVDSKEALTCGVLPQYHRDYVGHVLSAIRAHNGGIVLIHEIHPNTLKSLDAIIQAALADGYVFGSIDDREFDLSMR